MATQVIYKGKDGKDNKVTLSTRVLAEKYAATIKGATLKDVEADVPEVSVTKCPEATADVQRAATNAYYRSVKDPKNGYVRERPAEESSESESEAEAMAEHFGAARCAGQPMSDAFKDWDFVRGLS